MMLAAIAGLYDDVPDAEMAQTIQDQWRSGSLMPADEYICIVDRNGDIILHSANPEVVGQNTLRCQVLDESAGGLRDFDVLIQKAQPYVGQFIGLTGTKQIAAFAPVYNRRWTIGIHRSQSAFMDEVKASSKIADMVIIPVCAGFMLISLLLLRRRINAERRITASFKDAVIQSEARYKVYTDHTPYARFITNMESQILEANKVACELTGYSETELLEMSYPDIVSESYSGQAEWQFAELRSTPHFDFEVVLAHKSGTEISAAMHAVRLSRNRVMLFGLDISWLKSKREQEQRSMRLESTGRVVGQVAHDINQMLGPLVAYPDLLYPEFPEGHRAIRYLDQIKAAGNRISDINQQLLTIGRRECYEFEPVDLNEIVMQAYRSLPPLPGGRSPSISLKEDLKSVLGGAPQLLRVVGILLKNAIDAMTLGESLTISTENYWGSINDTTQGIIPEGRFVRLTITDTGCGMEKEQLEKIFTPFYSSKSLGKDRSLGLGLSIVSSLIKDHGGYISVSSTPGTGTSFSLYLPALSTSDADDDQGAPISGSETILVVDDEEVQRELISSLLENLGYKVTVATGGEAAIDILQKKPHDLLILDMVMPSGIGGTETYRRATTFRPRQRAIILSGYGDPERRHEVQSLGLKSFLKKPVSLEIIGRTVREELDRAFEDRVRQ